MYTRFALKDLGHLHYFLGIEFVWNKDATIHLHQSKYIKQLLHKANIHAAKAQPTPMITFVGHPKWLLYFL